MFFRVCLRCGHIDCEKHDPERKFKRWLKKQEKLYRKKPNINIILQVIIRKAMKEPLSEEEDKEYDKLMKLVRLWRSTSFKGERYNARKKAHDIGQKLAGFKKKKV